MTQQSKYDDSYPRTPKKGNASGNPPPLDPNKTKINKDPNAKRISIIGHKRKSSYTLDTILEEDK